jgi:hypothetical protein
MVGAGAMPPSMDWVLLRCHTVLLSSMMTVTIFHMV